MTSAPALETSPPGFPVVPGTPGDLPPPPNLNHSHAIAPAWATFVLSCVNNFGAAAVLMAVYFVTEQRFGFTKRQNLLLGLLQGATYIVGALSSGPGVRALGRRGISTRGVLALILPLMSMLAVLPWISNSAWSVWVMVGTFSALSGWLWPLIESYLASGRTDGALRRATGLFNIGWASTQVVTFLLVATMAHEAGTALRAICVLGLSHVISLPLLLALPANPSPHAHHAAPSASAMALRPLLAGFRIAIVLSYLLYSTLSPLMPFVMQKLSINPANKYALAAIWMATRVVMFVVMQQWHGWHGRRSTLYIALGVVGAGFVLCLLAPSVALLATGLGVFGIGMGVIYSGAFYYAMEVGSAGVDAGSKHEALIGLGYTGGPTASLAALGLVSTGAIAMSYEIPMILTAVGLIGVVMVALAVRAARCFGAR